MNTLGQTLETAVSRREGSRMRSEIEEARFRERNLPTFGTLSKEANMQKQWHCRELLNEAGAQ
jgi:hypothetical protein